MTTPTVQAFAAVRRGTLPDGTGETEYLDLESIGSPEGIARCKAELLDSRMPEFAAAHPVVRFAAVEVREVSP